MIAAVAVLLVVGRGGEGQAHARGIFWGAAIGPQLTGEQAPFDMGAVSAFAAKVGKRPSLIHFYTPFAECERRRCHDFPFPATVMSRIRRYGAIPMLSWSSQSIPSSPSEPNFQLADVSDGTYDSHIRRFAEETKAWGHPFFLRFDWEMNGNWFPWGVGANGNSSAEFVAAWRHVHDIFAAVGATNATWVWCPNVDRHHRLARLGSVYPGNAYVDWTCLDGYDYGHNPGAPARRTPFRQLFGASYREITTRIAPAKPMMIGEVGASQRGGQKPAWLREMLTAIPRQFPRIAAVAYFDTYDDGMDWPIETSPGAERAFARGTSAPQYVGPHFARLGGATIVPPGAGS